MHGPWLTDSRTQFEDYLFGKLRGKEMNKTISKPAISLHSRQYYIVTSPRLAPSGDTAKISKRQQIAKVLGVSGNPYLTFCLETSVASFL
jgi:hypothetical protein